MHFICLKYVHKCILKNLYVLVHLVMWHLHTSLMICDAFLKLHFGDLFFFFNITHLVLYKWEQVWPVTFCVFHVSVYYSSHCGAVSHISEPMWQSIEIVKFLCLWCTFLPLYLLRSPSNCNKHAPFHFFLKTIFRIV